MLSASVLHERFLPWGSVVYPAPTYTLHGRVAALECAYSGLWFLLAACHLESSSLRQLESQLQEVGMVWQACIRLTLRGVTFGAALTMVCATTARACVCLGSRKTPTL